MTKEVANHIGRKIGRLRNADQQTEPESWGSFMRLRVALEVSKPLPRALKIRTVLGDEHLVSFTYERKALSSQGGYPFGPWLRAATGSVSRNRGSQLKNVNAHVQDCRPRFTSRPPIGSSSPDQRARGTAIFGLGNPLTVKGLGDLLRDNKPTLVFLAETKCFASQIEVLKRKFNLFGCNVDPKGRSGGLAILWQKYVDIQLQSFSRYHIDVSVRVKESDEWWRFSGIYGEPDTSKRDHTWRLLRRRHSQSIRPWLCAGDFNEILEHSEKEGGPPRAEWLIRNFRN
ncbi:UNVERIFIED_CONTAM: hypothetical protein Sangu_2446700 [Sesamum angustifolium]|uniref:Endonuclease/exonuclease/phosphatase domain-containing protein n=1 Tax=Sesamum angustifolium TaxID=2727405 RepID=A0AAW2KX12_9LAMI